MTAAELDKALSVKPKTSTPKTIWLGFSVNSDGAKVLQDALSKAGISHRSEYVRSLVLADLKRRLAPKSKGKAEAEEPAEATA